MKSIQIQLAQIKAIDDMRSAVAKEIIDSYKHLRDRLVQEGVHEERIREHRMQCEDATRCVASAAERLLRTFKLNELIAPEIAKGIPLAFGTQEIVLLKKEGSDTAFLLYNTNLYRTTSWKLRVGGLYFSFVCGCANCCRGFEREELEAVVKEAATKASQYGIRRVVMRHNSGWPERPASALGVDFLEIEAPKSTEQLKALRKEIESVEGREADT